MPPADPAAKAVVLKPCPFCGEEAILNDPGGSRADCYDITIRCLGCDAEVRELVDQDEETDGGAAAMAAVISAWNRRITEITPQHGGDDE